jgi:hypothetical protein
VYGHTFQNRIVFLQFQSFRRVLSIFRRDVTGSSRHTAVLVLGAFKNHLHSVSFRFLSHNVILSLKTNYSDVFPIAEAFCHGVVQSGVQSFLIDGTQTGRTDIQADPAVLLYIIEFLPKQVYIETAFCASFRVRNVVAHHGFLSGDLTNFRHILSYFIVLIGTGVFKQSAK